MASEVAMPINILVVEDDEHIRGAVCAFLAEAGYAVDACRDGEEALVKIFEKEYSLCVFDILLPGADGHALLRALREKGDTPAIMMTALADDENQLRAFDAEADDYVTKPFKMQLLLKRVEALLRRSGVLAKEVRLGPLALLPEEYRAFCGGVELLLTKREFEILLLLARGAGRTLTHETILSRVWGYDFDGDAGTVHTHIKNLRAKLPADIIATVRGVGYRLEPPEDPQR
jgi:two-component system response regulator VanR